MPVSEYVQTVTISVEIDTNKRTVRREFETVEALLEWIGREFEELLLVAP